MGGEGYPQEHYLASKLKFTGEVPEKNFRNNATKFGQNHR